MHELTEAQHHVLQHALGMTMERRVPGYQNQFCVRVGSEDDALWAELVLSGLAVRGAELYGGKSVYYHCTRRGAMTAGMTGEQIEHAIIHEETEFPEPPEEPLLPLEWQRTTYQLPEPRTTVRFRTKDAGMKNRFWTGYYTGKHWCTTKHERIRSQVFEWKYLDRDQQSEAA